MSIDPRLQDMGYLVAIISRGGLRGDSNSIRIVECRDWYEWIDRLIGGVID